MKASELRIGNWVQFDSCIPAQITMADISDWYNDHNSHTFGDYIYEVRLTESWILNLGFQKISNYYRILPDIGIYAIYLKPTMHTWSVFINDQFIKRDVRYVHQLQNLYFALTGEELTIR